MAYKTDVENQKETVDSGKNEKNEKGSVIQVGSKEVLDRRGAFSMAERNVLALSQTQENGKVLETLKGSRFHQEIQRRISAGETEIILDLSREPDVTDEIVEELTKLRDHLKQNQGITLTLTGIKVAKARELLDHGMGNRGLKLYSEEHTDRALEDKEVAPLKKAA